VLGTEAALPISVLTGFLGSGKTTLLRRALDAPALADTAVIINEIGEIGLDHHLVETVDGPVVELPGGCLCCAVREDLAASLRALLARREEGRLAPFKRLVIETTGLADPGPILFTLAMDPALDSRLRLDRVVTTIDATMGEATLARYAEAAAQLAVADRVVITKSDLAEVRSSLLAGIDAINPEAERLLAGEITDFGHVFWGSSGEAERARLPPGQAAGHTHGIATHALQLTKPCSRLDFARALGGLARDRGEDLLRVKGLMRFSDKREAVAFVQAAQHALYPPIWLDERQHRGEENRLQFVVRGITLEEIMSHFAFAGGEPIRAAAAS
jgi:G3E family GTPase